MFCRFSARAFQRCAASARRLSAPSPRELSSARYAAAESALSSLPELQAARETPDASAAYDHLKRALDVVEHAGDRKLVIVAHGHLARHCYSVGHAEAERAHRLAAIDALRDDDDRDSAALLSAAYNGLALSCLRVGTSESMLAASSAAEAAQSCAASADMRLAASLHAALARPRSSDGQRMMLSAIANMGDDAAGPESVDYCGFANFFLAVHAATDEGGPGDEKALKKLRSLLERWETRDDFDLVELQVAAARQYIIRGPTGAAKKANLDAAHELLTSALKRSERLGNKLDMSEPLLGLAQLYGTMRRKIEAEGMYRSVEERFTGLKQKKAFTVLAAEVFCRSMQEFAQFLDSQGRSSEAEQKRKEAADVAASFPAILSTTPHVPLWFVDSCIEYYSVPPPVLL